MKSKAIRKTFILNCIVPVLFGAIIYLLFRENTLFSGFVRRFVPFPKVPTNALPNKIGLFIRYYLADMAWAYALTFAIGAIFEGDKRQILLSGTISIGFEALIEGFQKTKWIPGTFDWKDIAFEAVTSIVALIIIKHIKREDHHEKDYKID